MSSKELATAILATAKAHEDSYVPAPIIEVTHMITGETVSVVPNGHYSVSLREAAALHGGEYAEMVFLVLVFGWHNAIEWAQEVVATIDHTPTVN